MKSMETDTVSTGQFVIYFLVQVFLEAVGAYLYESLSHFNVILSILKELFQNHQIEQREAKTKEDSNLRNKNSLGRLGLNWKKDRICSIVF